MQRVGVFLRHEVVHRLNVAAGDGVGYQLGGARLGLGGAFTRFRLQERRLAFALGLQDLRLFLPSARRMAA